MAYFFTYCFAHQIVAGLAAQLWVYGRLGAEYSSYSSCDVSDACIGVAYERCMYVCHHGYVKIMMPPYAMPNCGVLRDASFEYYFCHSFRRRWYQVIIVFNDKQFVLCD